MVQSSLPGVQASVNKSLLPSLAWLTLSLSMLFGPLANAPALRHALLALMLLFSIHLLGRGRIAIRPAAWFFLPWLGLVLLSAFWSPDPRKTLIDAVWEVFGPLAGGLLAMHLVGWRSQIRFLQPFAALVLGCLLAALGAMQIHLGVFPSMPAWISATYQGLGVGSTVGVLACLIGVWLTVAAACVRERMAGGLLLLSGLVLGALGHNRMFWFALMIGLLPWAGLLWRRFQSIGRMVILGTILAGCIAGIVYSSVVARSGHMPEVDDVLPALQRSYAGDPRWEIWQAWLEIIDDRPVLGYGYGSRVMPIIGRQRIPDTLRDSTNAKQHAHNVALNVVLQTGLLGLGCFFWMLFGLLREIHKKTRSGLLPERYCGIAALSVLLAALAKGLTDDFFWSPANIVMWIFIGLMLGKRAQGTAAR